MGLSLYNKKRNFSNTPEPKGASSKGKRSKSKLPRFVVQEHHASALHFDFRLEIAGVLKSWAVPKGPSMNPNDKRLAMMVEDHPVDYLDFEGSIPKGNYGEGEVRVWDIGTFELLGNPDGEEQIADGKVTFLLHGKKLEGEFHLVRFKSEKEWLLFKHRDEYADETWEMDKILDYGSKREKPTDLSKLEKRTPKAVWKSNRKDSVSKASAKKTTPAKRTRKTSTAKASTSKPKAKARASKPAVAKKRTVASAKKRVTTRKK